MNKVNPDTLKALERAMSVRHEKLMRMAAHPGPQQTKAYVKASRRESEILYNCMNQFYGIKHVLD